MTNKEIAEEIVLELSRIDCNDRDYDPESVVVRILEREHFGGSDSQQRYRVVCQECRSETVDIVCMSCGLRAAQIPEHAVAPSVDTNAERQRDPFDVAREVMFDASERRADAAQEPTCAKCGRSRKGQGSAYFGPACDDCQAAESSALPSNVVLDDFDEDELRNGKD